MHIRRGLINAEKHLLPHLFYFITDRISEGGNAIASDCPFVSILSSELTDLDLELLHVSRS